MEAAVVCQTRGDCQVLFGEDVNLAVVFYSWQCRRIYRGDFELA